jgi:hypothetical protein
VSQRGVRQVRTGQSHCTGWPQLLRTVPHSGGVPAHVSAGLSGVQQTPDSVQIWLLSQSTQATPPVPHVFWELVWQTPWALQQPFGHVCALQATTGHWLLPLQVVTPAGQQTPLQQRVSQSGPGPLRTGAKLH